MASHGGVYIFPPRQNKYELLWQNPDVNNFVRSVSALAPDSVYWNRYDGHPTEMINGKVTTYFTHDFLGRYVFTNRNQSYAVTTRDIVRINQGIHAIVSFSGFTNHAHTALIDAEENIWIGTWEVLLKYRKTSFNLFSLKIEDNSEVF